MSKDKISLAETKKLLFDFLTQEKKDKVTAERKALGLGPLTTLTEYRSMEPYAQGYTVYMEEEWPGSELKGQRNPYPRDSVYWMSWERGGVVACQNVQDGEE